MKSHVKLELTWTSKQNFQQVNNENLTLPGGDSSSGLSRTSGRRLTSPS